MRTWQLLTDADHRVSAGRDGLAVVLTMSQWTLDYPADAKGLDFPFDRPYLDLYDRCLIALRASDAFLLTPPKDKKVVRALKRLIRLLAPVESEVPFHQNVHRLRRRCVV